MLNAVKPDALQSALAAMQDALERQAAALASLESRIDLLHEDVRRSAELTARLKLASENAKRLAESHQVLLSAIDKRLSDGGR